jgi:hypothetical protein
MSKKNKKTLLIALSFYAIAFQVIAQNNNPINKQVINELITTKIAMDRSGEFNDRYTIQLFYGEREEAIETKKNYDLLSLEWTSELRWADPYHSVWVGNYRSRLEADRALLKIKETFTGALVLKP